MSSLLHIIVGALSAQGILYIVERIKGRRLSDRVEIWLGGASAGLVVLVLRIAKELL